jgi:hypothetical protein
MNKSKRRRISQPAILHQNYLVHFLEKINKNVMQGHAEEITLDGDLSV